jgi:hypothetical protein
VLGGENILTGQVMNNELERIWKEAVVVLTREYSGSCLENWRKPRKFSVMIGCDLAKIRNKRLSKTRLKHYWYNNMFGVDIVIFVDASSSSKIKYK